MKSIFRHCRPLTCLRQKKLQLIRLALYKHSDGCPPSKGAKWVSFMGRCQQFIRTLVRHGSSICVSAGPVKSSIRCVIDKVPCMAPSKITSAFPLKVMLKSPTFYRKSIPGLFCWHPTHPPFSTWGRVLLRLRGQVQAAHCSRNWVWLKTREPGPNRMF